MGRLSQNEDVELHYRAEVLNDVYKKYLARLEREVIELTREMYFPTAVYPQVRRKTGIYERLPRFRKYSRAKSSSLSEGIPMILLSVLPVVVPRASWPCADPNDPHHIIEEESEFNFALSQNSNKLPRNSIILQDHGANIPEIRILPDNVDYNDSSISTTSNRSFSIVTNKKQSSSVDKYENKMANICEVIVHSSIQDVESENDAKTTSSSNNHYKNNSVTIVNKFSNNSNNITTNDNKNQHKESIVQQDEHNSNNDKEFSTITIITEEFE